MDHLFYLGQLFNELKLSSDKLDLVQLLRHSTSPHAPMIDRRRQNPTTVFDAILCYAGNHLSGDLMAD